MSRNIKILCVGDVVGASGCEFLRKKLADFKRENNIDVCIVNGENSAVGNGMLPQSCNSIFTSGADFITGGNHSFKRREIFEYLDSADAVIRPANFGDGVWGKGYGIIDKGAYSVGVINLLGRVWLEGHGDPFETAEKIIDELKKETKIIIVDFHAEATAEKKALGYFLDGKVSAIFGTHTHIQTSDAQVLANGTGYITDLGMTGVKDSVLGKDIEVCVHNFADPENRLPIKDAKGECIINGIVADIDISTRKCTAISII